MIITEFWKLEYGDKFIMPADEKVYIKITYPSFTIEDKGEGLAKTVDGSEHRIWNRQVVMV